MKPLIDYLARALFGRVWVLTILFTLGMDKAGAETPSEPRAPLLEWGATPPDIPDGYMIIQGDIQVPIGFGEQDMPWSTNFWPGGVVPYDFDANVSTNWRAAMLDAMAQWTAVANITFRERTTEAGYVHIQNSNVNSSAVGRQGGRQIINIVSWWSRFTMCHELAHMLGFWHEQSRPDRDTYVDIQWGHIQPGEEHNFYRQDSAGRYGPYDFDSLMHYDAFAYSRDGERTIIVRPPNEYWQYRIGQTDHLSRMDKIIMGFIYSFPNWRFVDGSYSGTQLGTFFQPYRSFGTGVSNTPNGGTLWVQPGTYSAHGTYSRPMTWQAPLGGVTLH